MLITASPIRAALAAGACLWAVCGAAATFQTDAGGCLIHCDVEGVLDTRQDPALPFGRGETIFGPGSDLDLAPGPFLPVPGLPDNFGITPTETETAPAPADLLPLPEKQ